MCYVAHILVCSTLGGMGMVCRGASWRFEPNGDLNSALSFRLTARLDSAVLQLDNCIPANPTMDALYTCNKKI